MSRNEQNAHLMGDILSLFYKHQLKINTYHFQTEYYGHHVASDEYLKKFRNNLDRFMEVAQGKTSYGKISITSVDISFDTISSKNIGYDLEDFITKIRSDIYPAIIEHADLTNIMDEIIADVNQFKYLLGFK